MLRLAFDFIITWRETRTRPNAYYYCFSFPIKYYKTTPGKYRISTSMWNDLEKINLNAEFEIE